MSKRVIDISKWQNVTDWEDVKDDVDGIIFRIGFGEDSENQDDPIAETAYNFCTENRIPFGFYFYTYAYNAYMISSEVDHINRLLKKYDITDYADIFLGLYLDVEDADGYKAKNGYSIYDIDTTNNLIQAIYDYVDFPHMGLYGSCALIKKLDYSYFDYVWIAHYSDSCDSFDDSFRGHQYTSCGSVKGIEGNVDVNEWFDDSAWVSIDTSYDNNMSDFDNIFDLYSTVRNVLKGDYGDGEARKEALGDHYNEVQEVINLYYPYLASTKDLISCEKGIDKNVFYDLLYYILEL